MNSRDPNRGPTRALSKLWAGNAPLDDLNAALKLAHRQPTAETIQPDQRFWSTKARPASSTIKEVMRINLVGPRLINSLSLAVSLFPHDLYLEYLESGTQNWRPCLDARSAHEQPVRQSVRESHPSVIPSASVMRGHIHPQHGFSGHWRTLNFKIRPINAQSLRVVLQRNTDGRPPTSVFGRPVDYSLAVRNLSLGFQIESRDDVPSTNPAPGSYAEYESFATTTDAFGSKVDFSLRVNRARNVLQNQAIGESNAALVWRSDPQPIPWAVVNFYVDMRDPKGKAQIVDRFFVDPLYEGANLNLYWSNDEPTGTFAAVDEPLDFPVVSRHDGRGITGNVLHGGEANRGYLAYVDLDNGALGFDASRRWWLGAYMNFKPGNPNLLTNPDFELGSSGWSAHNASTLAWEGPGSLLVTSTSSVNPTGAVATVVQGVVSGTDYTVTADITALDELGVGIGVDWSGSSGYLSTSFGNTGTLVAGARRTDRVRFTAPAGAISGRAFIDGGKLVSGKRFRLHGATLARADTDYVRPVLDFGPFNLARTPLGLRLNTPHGDNLHVAVDPFDPATPVGIVVGHDGERLFLRARIGEVTYEGTLPLSVPLTGEHPEKLRFGAFQASTAELSNLDLNSFVLKVDEDYGSDTADEFLDDPTPFVHTGRTDNALVRYDYTFALPTGTGFVGGPQDRYQDLAWAPVARDFVLRKGFLYFPPTKAKYWKFEFCGLNPEPYEVFRPINRTVLTYPVSMWAGPVESPTLTGANLNALVPGASTAIAESRNNLYRDTTARMGTGGNGARPSATTARVVWDAASRENVGAAYWAWRFLPLHGAPRTPRFQATGVHSYETTVVEHTTKLAYFVGLKAIEAYRLNYLTIEDSPQIVDMFHDTDGLERNNWTLTEDHLLTSGGGHYAEATSKVLPSQRLIRAVQFAAQQSAPKQLLPDDDFIDPEHRYWQSVGDAHLPPGVDTDPVLGTMVEVRRSLTEQSWSAIEDSFDSWGDLVATAGFWSEIESAEVVADNLGGISSVAVTTPAGGRVYAAARVMAEQDLVNPLRLQIVDDRTDRVLMEERFEVKGRQVAEWFGGFTINDIAEPQVWRWSEFYNVRTGPYLMDSFARADATSLTTMDSGQRWENAVDAQSNPLSLQIVGELAKVTAAGQENFIDSQSPFGTLEVTVGAMGSSPDPAVKLLDLEPFILAAHGTLYVHGYGVPAMFEVLGPARTVQANDKIRLEMMPTSAVPANQADPAADPVLTPYSMLVYLNDVWIKTLAHSRGARTLRGIKGALGQEFARFSWTPRAYGNIHGRCIIRLPHDGNGTYTSDETQIKKFLDLDGNTWTIEGGWDLTAPRETAGAAYQGLPVSATANGSVMVTETGSWYGSMHVFVRNVASTETTGVRHGRVLCIDYDNGIFVDVAGSIVDRNNINYGTLIPGGIPNSSVVSLQFVRTSRLLPGNRGGVTPEQAPDQIIASVDGTVVGRYVGEFLPAWRGTRRGVAGDVYSGTRPVGSPYTLDTSFRALTWAPDIVNIALDPANPTWHEISDGGLSTWDDVVQGRVQVNPKLRVRLVQHGESTDRWSVDTLSLFVDPIMWFFSNDGGYLWYPALDIRNNPNGVLAFPQSVVASHPDQQPGKSLVWKAVAYAPGCHISSLVIRPWYAGMLSGVTHNVGISNGGPNVMPYDHYGDIRNDSRFRSWASPIPQDWWHHFRMLKRAGETGVVEDLSWIFPSATDYPSAHLFPGDL